MDDYKKYGIEYPWFGGKHVIVIHATSPEDAMERIRAAAAHGRCYTPYGIDHEIPAFPGAGPLVRFIVWYKNLFGRCVTWRGGHAPGEPHDRD